MGVLSGPMFEPASSELFKSSFSKEGAHYNIYQIKGGVAALRSIFPDGKANELNFCIFSTSGVHGSYTTLEEIAVGLEKYGDDPEFDDDAGGWPDDWQGNDLTVLIVHPRIVCLRYGNVAVTKADLPYLLELRATSQAVMAKLNEATNPLRS